ncbi:MAG: hypothetical protein ACTSX6_09145 [Candidatus Heimdallarchaeaceae archaeon]
MKRFEEWIKATLKEIHKANLSDEQKLNLLIHLRTLKENRTLTNLDTFMRTLHHLKLHNLCPTQEEIENWIKQEIFKRV